MNAKKPEFLRYYIRVTDPALFEALVDSANNSEANDIEKKREGGYLVLRTNNEFVWRELFLYGQMLAQASGATIEAGDS